MPPFLGLRGARSFCLLHPLFRIDTEDQPHRQLVSICQLHNHIRDLPRIAFLPLLVLVSIVLLTVLVTASSRHRQEYWHR